MTLVVCRLARRRILEENGRLRRRKKSVCVRACILSARRQSRVRNYYKFSKIGRCPYKQDGVIPCGPATVVQSIVDNLVLVK